MNSGLIAEMNNQLRRIADALEELVEGSKPDSKPPDDVHFDESMGTCPSCEHFDVQQKGNYPQVMYKCGNCSYMWVNDSDAWFET